MTKKKSIMTLMLAFVLIVPTMFTLTACGKIKHEHTLKDVTSVEATCTTAGNIAYKHCSGCDKNFDADGNELESVTIKALGHDYEHGTEVENSRKEATCTEKGEYLVKCSRCNQTEKREIAMVAHDLGEEIEEIPATCTETGRKAHKDCNTCDGHFDNNGNEITDWTIPALGHDLGEEIEEIPATCTETGRKAHKDCNQCDGHFDNNGNEITDLTIPATGHNYNEKGVCSVCGNNNSHILKTGQYNAENFSITTIDKKVYFNFVYDNSVTEVNNDLLINTKALQAKANSTDDALIASVKVYTETTLADNSKSISDVCTLTCQLNQGGYLEWVLPSNTKLTDGIKYYVVVEFNADQTSVQLYVEAMA